MKRNLFLSAILPFSLAVALCACGSTPGESTPSEKTQSSVSQAQTDSAATGNEISIGNNFSIEAGTVLSDGSIYFVGREGADGFCAYVSTDDGDSWTKEELPWADQTVVGIKLRPDGFMLGMQGQQVVYAARGEDLKTADISALGAIDGISAVYPIDGDTFTVTGGRTETFVNEDGQEQETIHPLPFEDMVLQYDGSLVTQWGEGIAADQAGYYASDEEKLYYVDFETNECRSLDGAGQIDSYGVLATIKGSSFCRNGIFYRNSALASYQEMQRQNNLSAQVNQASAEDVALDIKDTQAEIEQLEQLVNQQGVISSPFSGVISNVEAEVGTESTQTFCTIYDTSKGYLFACELPAAQASDCQTGLSAVIKQGDQTETAAITAISENAENDTVDITIQLTATDWKVGPADAEIVLSEQDYDLCLPNTAIHQDNQGDFVFAVEEKNTVLGTQNVLVRIPVTVLEVGQSQTSIEGAILPEDSIVVQSTRSLEAGSKVRVKNENA